MDVLFQHIPYIYIEFQAYILFFSDFVVDLKKCSHLEYYKTYWVLNKNIITCSSIFSWNMKQFFQAQLISLFQLWNHIFLVISHGVVQGLDQLDCNFPFRCTDIVHRKYRCHTRNSQESLPIDDYICSTHMVEILQEETPIKKVYTFLSVFIAFWLPQFVVNGALE